MPLASESSPLAPSSTIMLCRLITPKKTTIGCTELTALLLVICLRVSSTAGLISSTKVSTETQGTPSACVLSAPLLSRNKAETRLQAIQVTECFEQVFGSLHAIPASGRMAAEWVALTAVNPELESAHSTYTLSSWPSTNDCMTP